MSQRSLPHSEEAERACLACVLLQPELSQQLFDSLAEEAFYLERHQKIYGAYRAVTDGGDAIDLRTVQASLEEDDDFEYVGGQAYLVGLDLDLPDLSGFGRYLAIVRERYAKRRLILAAEEIRSAAMNGNSSAEVIAAAEATLADIERHQLAAAPVSKLGDLALDLDFQRPDQGLMGVSSGIRAVDKITGGWRPGALVTLAGATGMGKTSAGWGFAIAAARSGESTLAISLEMTECELVNRFLSSVSHVPHESIDWGKVPNGRIQDVIGAVRLAQDLPLWVSDKTPQTISSISATARQHKTKHGLGLLVIDYLTLIDYVGTERDQRLKLTEMSRALKMLARSLEIPVILLHQIRRIEARRPVLIDLKESGDIENNSNQVVFCYREGYYDDAAPQHTAELIIAKNRGGKTGKVEVAWSGETMTFRDLERRHEKTGW